jgi:hypothetical protein
MTIEETEGIILQHAASAMLFRESQLAEPSYGLTQSQLLSLIRLAHTAGEAEGLTRACIHAIAVAAANG